MARGSEISGAAPRNLIWDADVHSDTVEIRVLRGCGTLTADDGFRFPERGVLRRRRQRYGVVGVTNEFKVANP